MIGISKRSKGTDLFNPIFAKLHKLCIRDTLSYYILILATHPVIGSSRKLGKNRLITNYYG